MDSEDTKEKNAEKSPKKSLGGYLSDDAGVGLDEIFRVLFING